MLSHEIHIEASGRVSLVTQVLSRMAKLPAPAYLALRVERDLAVPMPDGAVLLADRLVPRHAENAPIVLLRSPYGRRRLEPLTRMIAAQGYQVVTVSCRGTFGSGGDWEPYFHEEDDGRATLAWLAEQPWFVPKVATFGPSYLGLTQWAVADDPPPWLRGMAIGVSSSNFRDLVYTDGIFSLDLAMKWIHGLEHQETPLLGRVPSMISAERVMADAADALPVSVADRVLVGHASGYYADWVRHEPPSEDYWARIDFSGAVGSMPPVAMVGGWYDIFLDQQLADFVALQEAGRPATITIGPWDHSNFAGMLAMVEDAVRFFAGVLGDVATSAPAVRVFVMGSHAWRELDRWPPEPAEWRALPLGEAGSLGGAGPLAGHRIGGSSFTYDPADPTPAIGGRALNHQHAGPKAQAPRESRPDVVCFSSDPIRQPVTVIGTPTIRLTLRTTSAYGDLFLRLCDVSGARSINICDGAFAITPETVQRAADGTFSVEVPIGPTAHTFVKGHRIRLQVSAGAHPLLARNLGLGEPLASARRMTTNTYEIDHADSVLTLPVMG